MSAIQTAKLPIPSGLIPITYPPIRKKSDMPNFAAAYMVQRHAAPGASINNCTVHVENEIASGGGSMVMGWDVSVGPNFLEATPHAILRRLDGILVDVSPCPTGRRDTCFVERTPSWTKLPNSIFYVAPSARADFRETVLYESASKHVIIALKSGVRPGALIQMSRDQIAKTVKALAPDLNQQKLLSRVLVNLSLV